MLVDSGDRPLLLGGLYKDAWTLRLTRHKPSGQLDETFAQSGVLDIPNAWGVALTRGPDGQIHVLGVEHGYPGRPFVARIGIAQAAPLVIEYVDYADFPEAIGGHYFYSAEPAEQSGIESGMAGAWLRTGMAFPSGGSTPVCRFYGSVTPGPNSHFFTAVQSECDALRALQIIPQPTNVGQWNYEGLGFLTTAPSASACPPGTRPLYRAYNKGFARGFDSNHRFALDADEVTDMANRFGWANEGVAMCVPQ